MSDRELDAWIAENVMGWHLGPTRQMWISKSGGHACSVKTWSPSGDKEQAFEVVEKMRERLGVGAYYLITSPMIHPIHGDTRYQVSFLSYDGSGDLGNGWAEHESLPMAICLAAKQAMEKGKQ